MRDEQQNYFKRKKCRKQIVHSQQSFNGDFYIHRTLRFQALKNELIQKLFLILKFVMILIVRRH